MAGDTPLAEAGQPAASAGARLAPGAGHSFAYLFERFPSFVQTFVHREAGEMIRQGMNPLLVSIRRPDDPPDLSEGAETGVFYLPPEKDLRAEVDRLRAAGQLPRRVHRTIPARRAESDSQRIFEAAWLAPRLKRAGIGHVHAHFGGMAARTAWWLWRLHGIPYSFTGHANDIFCDTDFPVSNRALARDARFIVTETDYARQWMEEKHPAARGKVFRIFNGISMEGCPARQSSATPPTILSVGRYVEKKGFSDLIKACGLLQREGRALECLIVGGGPLEPDLQREIEREALTSSVRLVGPKPQADVRRMLADASVFALACVVEASGGSDNLPTVIMEAMACGTPVISTRVAGVPEMIADGHDGLLAPPSDPARLAAALARLLDDSEFAERLGARGRETARDKFDIRKTTAELKRLLVSRAAVCVPDAAETMEPGLRGLRPSFVAAMCRRAAELAARLIR